MTPSPTDDATPLRPLEAVGLLAIAALACLHVSRPIWTIDPFWQMAIGHVFWEGGALVQTDVFSAVDPDRPWRSFQVGYELLCALADRIGGLPAMRGMHGAVLLTSFALFHHGLRRRLRWGPLASMVFLSVLLVLFEDRVSVRAHVFNLLGWSLLLPILLRGPEHLRRSDWIRTGVVVACWGWVHSGGAFVFAMAALSFPVGTGFHALVDARVRSRFLPALLFFACAFLPILLSPNALHGIVQAASALEAVGNNNPEFRPSWYYFEIAEVWGHWVCGAFPLLTSALAIGIAMRCLMGLRQGKAEFLIRIERVGVTRVALACALLVASLHSARFAYLSLFALLALSPGLIGDPGWQIRRKTQRALLVVALVGFVGMGWQFHITAQAGTVEATLERNFEGPDVEEARFPTLHAEFLRGTGFEGAIHCQPNWGGYLLWRLWPRATVTADGRGSYAREVNDVLAYTYDRTHMQDASSGPAVEAAYTRYATDAVVHQHPVWPQGHVPSPERWEQVFSDPRGAIWIRRDTPRGAAYLENLTRARKTHSAVK